MIWSNQIRIGFYSR